MVNSWGRAIGYGVLVWLVPFVVAFLVFFLHESQRPLFESIMAVTVAASAVIFGLAYVKRLDRRCVREGFTVGVLWFLICIAIDAPLMLLGGPMKMTIAEYMGDIGLTYLVIPIVTLGLGSARGRP